MARMYVSRISMVERETYVAKFAEIGALDVLRRVALAEGLPITSVAGRCSGARARNAKRMICAILSCRRMPVKSIMAALGVAGHSVRDYLDSVSRAELLEYCEKHSIVLHEPLWYTREETYELCEPRCIGALRQVWALGFITKIAEYEGLDVASFIRPQPTARARMGLQALIALLRGRGYCGSFIADCIGCNRQYVYDHSSEQCQREAAAYCAMVGLRLTDDLEYTNAVDSMG
jgi:hypothetical protein